MCSSESSDAIEAGLVANIFTSDIFWAERGNGAFKNGTPILCNSPKTIKNRIVAVDFDHRHIQDTLVKPYELLCPNISLLRLMGACALELSLMASGAFDMYIDVREKLRVVDFLAGIFIIREAGGEILDLNGNKFVCENFDVTQKHSLIAMPKSLILEIKKRLKQIGHHFN